MRLILAILLVAPRLHAADEAAAKVLPAMSTDRPDFTEATDVMPRGMAQLEGGLLISRHDKADSTLSAFTGPNLLMRIGLGRGMELRLGTEGLLAEREFDTTHHGLADASIGTKVRLWEEKSWLPAVSAIGAVSLPVGSARFTSGSRDLIGKLCWSKTLPRGWDAGGNFNVGPGTERDVSVTAGHELASGLRAYAEIYRIAPVDGDEASHTVFNMGVSRTLGQYAMVDVEAGHTISAGTPLWFFGVGFAVRR